MSDSSTVPVAVVDDDAATREAIVVVLDSIGIAAHTFASAQDFLAAPEASSYRCLVMDIRMPGLSGIEAQRRMKELGIAAPVIFITGHGDIEMAVDAMKRGAVDFLTKPFRDQVLIDTVQSVLSAAAARQAPPPVQQAASRHRLEQLTPREREILVHVAGGRRSKQIAADLGITVKTVDEYRSRILGKMQVGTSSELAAVAATLGLLPPA